MQDGPFQVPSSSGRAGFSVGRFLRSVRSSESGQLAHRLRRMAKAWLLRRAAPLAARLERRLAAPAPAPAAHGDALPLSLFAPRQRGVQCEGRRWSARLVGRRVVLDETLEWFPTDASHLFEIQLHGMEWLEALDEQAFVACTLGWIESCRPYRRRSERAAWQPYALAVRCVVWMQELGRRPTLASEVTRRMLESLAAQVRFLESNLELDLGGNHLVKDLKALLFAGRFFSGVEAARWRARGETLLERELARQVLDDGVHFELSPSYHLQVFADLLECAPLLAARPLRERLEGVLERMAGAALDFTAPDGGPSLFGDGGLSMAYSTRECLAAYTRLTGQPVRPRRVVALRSAGYYGLRGSGSHLLVRCGPIAADRLPAHAHADLLAFEWSVGGARMVVDAGVYEYAPGGWREWSRSTAAHNTVTVGDLDQAELWASFRMGRRAEATLERFEVEDDGRRIVVVGSHDGFALSPGSPRHRRRISATARQVEVEDEVWPGKGQPVRARLLLHPEVRVRWENGCVAIERGEVRVRLETGAAVSLERAWWCPDPGVAIATTQVVLYYGAAPARGSFRLVDLGVPSTAGAAARGGSGRRAAQPPELR